MLENLHGTNIIIISSTAYENGDRSSSFAAELAMNRRVFFVNPAEVGLTTKPNFFHARSPEGVDVIQLYTPTDSYKEKLAAVEALINDEHLGHLTIWTDSIDGVRMANELNHDVLVFDMIPGRKSVTLQVEQILLSSADIILNSLHTDDYMMDEIKILNLDFKKHVYVEEVHFDRKEFVSRTYAMAQYAHSGH